MTVLANGYCTVCGQFGQSSSHICPFATTASSAVPLESVQVGPILEALREITKLLREIEYHLRTR